MFKVTLLPTIYYFVDGKLYTYESDFKRTFEDMSAFLIENYKKRIPELPMYSPYYKFLVNKYYDLILF